MERVLEQLMDFEVTNGIQAGRHERSGSPPDLPEWVSGTTAAHAAGHAGVAGTEAAARELFSVILEPRRLAERALTAVIQEAWIGGMSTRKVDGLVQALGMTGITKSQVSALCRDIDERVKSFLERPLEGEWPYLWLDATLFESAQGRSGGVGRRDNRQRRQPGRAAGNSRLGAGRLRGPSLLGGLPAPLAPARLEWCPVDHFRRPRGLEGRDQPSLYG